MYLQSIMYDVESLVKKANPYSTNIIVTVGGAMVLQESIREVLGDRYNIVLGNSKECLYSDLMGLKLICTNENQVTNNNTPIEVVEEASVTEEVQLAIDTIEESKAKSNFDLFVTLRKSGYTLKQIHQEQLLPLTYNSLKNYNCKYNKLQTV